MCPKQFHNDNTDLGSSGSWGISLKRTFLILYENTQVGISTEREAMETIPRPACRVGILPWSLSPRSLQPPGGLLAKCRETAVSRLMKGRDGWSLLISHSSVICWILVLQQSSTTKATDYKEDNIFITAFFLVGKIVPEVDYTVLAACRPRKFDAELCRI